MKKYLLFTLLFVVAHISYGQLNTCTPDPSYQDSAVGVYPLPYDEDTNPDGGIDKSACIGHPYQFVFQIVVPDTLDFSGSKFPLDKMVLDTGNAISNLPAGLDYACNPSNCVFENGTVGCLVIYGTVINSAPTGDYDLTIMGTLYTSFIPIPFTFPDPALYPGKYTITVEPENGTTCYKVSTSEARSDNYFADVHPNPLSQTGTMVIFSKRAADIEISLKGVNGAEYQLMNTKVFEGKNEVKLDISDIPNGVYFYRIGNKDDFAVGKMVVQH